MVDKKHHRDCDCAIGYKYDPKSDEVIVCPIHTLAPKMFEFIKNAEYFDEETMREAEKIISEVEK